MAVDPSRSRQQSAPAFVSDFCDRIASLVFDDSHHRVFYSGTCADVERRVCYTVDAGIVFTFSHCRFLFPEADAGTAPSLPASESGTGSFCCRCRNAGKLHLMESPSRSSGFSPAPPYVKMRFRNHILSARTSQPRCCSGFHICRIDFYFHNFSRHASILCCAAQPDKRSPRHLRNNAPT